METRANYIAVGAFTLAAIGAVFIIVFWLGKFKNGENLVPVDVRIQGSVSGLGKGSAVQFNGITVGRVKGLSLDPTDPQFVIVHAEINFATPLREDTKATIGIRGLSGGAFISLEGGDKESPSLLAGEGADGTDGPVPIIQGDPAALADLLTRVNEIASRTERVMGALEKFVKSNQSTVNNTLSNVEVFSKALATNSEGVGKFMDSAGNVAIALERMTKQLDGSTQRVENILNAVDPEKISETVNNIKDFSQAVADQKQQMSVVMGGAASIIVQLNSSVNELSGIVGKVDNVVTAVDAADVKSAISNFSKSAERAEQVLAALDSEKLTSTVSDIADTANDLRAVIGAVKPEAVGELVNNLGAASQKVATLAEAIDPASVNAAVTSIEKASARAETVLAGVDGEKLGAAVSNIADTAKGLSAVVGAVKPEAVGEMVNNLGAASEKVAMLAEAIDPASVNAAVTSIEKASAQAETVLAGVDGEKLGAAVSDIADTAKDLRAVVSGVRPEAVGELVNDLGSASKKVSTLVASIDPSGINAAVISFEKAAAQAENVMAAIDSTKIGQALDSFSAAGASAEKALSGIEPAAINAMISDLGEASKDASQLMKALDPDGINLAIQNISQAAAGAQEVVSDVRNVTSGLGTRGGDINQMVTDASQMVARLNESSKKIDGVVTQVDELLGSGGGSELAADAQRTLTEIRRAARSLSQSVNRVANNVDGFTRRGLGDVQGLVSDARKSVESINRVMRNIGDNPSSLLTGSGGSRIRESSGARPRR